MTTGVTFDFGAPISDPITVRGTGNMVVPSTASLEYSGPYFDGDTPDVPDVAVYEWQGPPNASPSMLTITVPDPAPPVVQVPAEGVPVPSPATSREFKTLQLVDFRVEENATPLTPSDTLGGAGTMTLQSDENDQTPYLQNVAIDLVDPAQGTTRGTIRGVSADNGHSTLVADSRLTLLVVKRTAEPFIGTLHDALLYYFGLCGITDGIVIDDTLGAIEGNFPGFSGMVWDQLKKLLTIYEAEISLVSNNVVVRPVRGFVSENYRDSSRSWAYDVSQQARSVEIYRYDTREVVSGLLYPQGGWNSDVEVLSVAAGETLVRTIPLEGSASAVEQPTYLETIPPEYSSTSVYNVSGNDNLPIEEAQWFAMGGSLKVEIGEDTRSLIVTIIAPREERFSPYRIGMPDGESFYSTLRIVGDGIVWNKELHTFYTAVDPDLVSQEVGATVDVEYIQTWEQLTAAALTELKFWGGTRRTVNVSTRGINRLGDTGSYAYATLEDFDAWWDDDTPGATLEDFDTAADALYGETLGDFDVWWIEYVQDDFANQAFGNIAGARVRDDHRFNRIRTATITPAGISYTAWEDSVLGDFDEVWGEDVTLADFDVEWADETLGDFDATPLRKAGA